jgi:hypothetical protein
MITYSLIILNQSYRGWKSALEMETFNRLLGVITEKTTI